MYNRLSQDRNNEIYLLKFIFALVILLNHSKYLVSEEFRNVTTLIFYNGSIAVEFFFIVSGYFFAKSCLGQKVLPWKLMVQKVRSFFLPAFIAYLITFCGIHIVNKNVAIISIIKDLLRSIYEPVLLRNTGFSGIYYNGPAWYLSALLLTMTLIVVPLYKHRENYLYIISPLIAVFLLGYLSHTYPSIRKTGVWSSFMYECQLRAIAEVNIGIFLYGIIQKVQCVYTKAGKIVISLMELILYIAIFAYMQIYHTSDMDYAIILLISVAVYLSFTQQTYLADIAQGVSGIALFLGKYSLYIYLNQAVWYTVIPRIFPDKSYLLKLGLYSIAVFGTALFAWGVEELLKRKVFSYIKNYLVVERGVPRQEISHNKIVVVGVGISLCLAVLVFTVGYSMIERNGVVKKYIDTVEDSKYIMHALGGDEGSYSYINSLETLKKLYNQGYRLYEVDVNLTSDDKAVLVHGWSKTDYEKRIGTYYYNTDDLNTENQYVPTYDEFMDYKIQGKYKATSFCELVDFMKQNTDMYVMIDIGRKSYNETKHIYEILVSETKDVDVLRRFIVGGRTKGMIQAIRDVYDFPIINLYLASEDKREPDWLDLGNFVKYCKDNGIISFSVSSTTYGADTAEILDVSGLVCYVFTVNDLHDEKRYREMGVEIIGTDFLR